MNDRLAKTIDKRQLNGWNPVWLETKEDRENGEEEKEEQEQETPVEIMSSVLFWFLLSSCCCHFSIDIQRETEIRDDAETKETWKFSSLRPLDSASWLFSWIWDRQISY